MNRKLILLMLFCLTSTPKLLAQEDVQRLVVWQKNGEKIYFDLEELPETTFDGSLLIISTSKSNVSFQRENILRYTYEGQMTAIGKPLVQPGEVRVVQTADEMAFDGLSEGTAVALYTADGRMLGSQKAQRGLTTTVSLKTYPSGTYIIKVNDTTYKFLKR